MVISFIITTQQQQQLVLILIMMINLLALEKSFSHARQVKEVKMVIVTDDHKELAAADPDSNFSFQKLEVKNRFFLEEIFTKIGRKIMTSDDEEENMTNKRSKEEILMRKLKEGHSVGNRTIKGNGEENWKDDFMAFTADYGPPKPHPPKNN